MRQCRTCRRERTKANPPTTGPATLDTKARRRLLDAYNDGVTKEDLFDRFRIRDDSLTAQLALARKEAA